MGLFEWLSLLLRHWGQLLALLVLGLSMLGLIGKGLGVFHLFRDDDEIFGGEERGGIESRFARCGDRDGEREPERRTGAAAWVSRLFASPAYWSGAGWVATTGLIHLMVATGPAAEASSESGALRFGPAPQEATLLVLSAAVLASVLISVRHMSHPRSDLRPWSARRRWSEPLRAGLGGLSALLAVLLVQMASGAVGAAAGPTGAAAASAVPFAAGVAWVFSRPNALPCVSIFSLAVIVVLAFEALARLGGPAAQLLWIGAFIWIWLANGRFAKYRLPGFESLYDVRSDPRSAPVGGTPGGHAQRVKPLDALQTWHAKVARSPEEKPILVLFATSGGAYRAAFWTSLILDRLIAGSREEEPRWPGLDQNTRLVTGASGGMVAGAYFVAMSAENKLEEGVTCRIIGDTRRALRKRSQRQHPIGRDSLSPVMHQMVRSDLWHSFIPSSPRWDRGRMLEAQWETLNRSFETLREGEEAGLVPSLVFSPMLVESGALALMSNLDLGALRRRSTRIHDRPDAELDASVEVLDQFEGTQAKVTLATAVRLSATFPYISPAVSLPTRVDRRVVDAGYFDNYGIDIASGFLEDPDVRDWVQAKCAGVAIIEVRAFEGQPLTRRPSALARAWHFLTSPPEALFSARRASQVFRNNQQLRALVDRFGRAEGAAGDFLRVFTLEAVSDVSMSWYLRLDELEALEGLLNEPSPEERDSAQATVKSCGGREGFVAALQAGDPAARRARYTLQRQAIASELAALEAFWKEPSGPDPREAAPLPTWLAAATQGLHLSSYDDSDRNDS